MGKKEVNLPILGHSEGVTLVFSEEKESAQTTEIEKADLWEGLRIPVVGHEEPVAIGQIFHPGHK